MAKTTMLLDRPPTTLGPVADDPTVRAASAALEAAVTARDRTAAEARALRTFLASPPSAGDGLAVLRARVELPTAEMAEAEAALGYEEAAIASARAEAEARAQRGPAARARVAVLDGEVMPRMVRLRDQLAAENAALGGPVIPLGELLWPEFLGPSPGDSLLELRRRLLTQAGWLA